jgi:Flp pilus assembly protein TadG
MRLNWTQTLRSSSFANEMNIYFLIQRDTAEHRLRGKPAMNKIRTAVKPIKSIAKKMSQFWERKPRFSYFKSDTNGNTGTIFALSVTALLLASGASIDYVRYTATLTKLQGAVDTASLAAAAGEDVSEDARIAAGKKMFDTNIAGGTVDLLNIRRDFEVRRNSIKAEASVEMPTTLMKLAGIDTMDVKATAEVKTGGPAKYEIALVLDYSSSMLDSIDGEVKYIAMKKAAKKLVEDIQASNPEHVKVGLVPFASIVRVTLPKAYVKGELGMGDWTGCTQDRLFPHNRKDNTPTAADGTKWKQTPVDMDAGMCEIFAARNLTVQPLTSDFVSVGNQINNMTPGRGTHIALGAEFGFHLLSPNLPFAEGTAYNSDTQKIMVLMTDGQQTTKGHGPGTAWDAAQGEENLEAICQNAKAEGITIMSIAFDLYDGQTVDRLRSCTSDPDKYFFMASDGDDVDKAFEKVRNSLTEGAYLSK